MYGGELSLSDVEIMAGMVSNFKVASAKRMQKAIKQLDNTFTHIPTKLVLLTLQTQNLLIQVVIHFVRLEVDPKINSLFNVTLVSNLMKHFCRSLKICTLCNYPQHDSPYANRLKCVICRQAQCALDPTCSYREVVREAECEKALYGLSHRKVMTKIFQKHPNLISAVKEFQSGAQKPCSWNSSTDNQMF